MIEFSIGTLLDPAATGNELVVAAAEVDSTFAEILAMTATKVTQPLTTPADDTSSEQFRPVQLPETAEPFEFAEVSEPLETPLPSTAEDLETPGAGTAGVESDLPITDVEEAVDADAPTEPTQNREPGRPFITMPAAPADHQPAWNESSRTVPYVGLNRQAPLEVSAPEILTPEANPAGSEPMRDQAPAQPVVEPVTAQGRPSMAPPLWTPVETTRPTPPPFAAHPDLPADSPTFAGRALDGLPTIKSDRIASHQPAIELPSTAAPIAVEVRPSLTTSPQAPVQFAANPVTPDPVVAGQAAPEAIQPATPSGKTKADPAIARSEGTTPSAVAPSSGPTTWINEITRPDSVEPPALARRIEQWVATKPTTPSSLTLDFGEGTDLKVTVALRTGGLHVTITGNSTADASWIQELSSALESRGLSADVSADSESARQDTDQPEEQRFFQPPPRRRPAGGRGLRL